MTLPALLTVDEVMARYKLRARSARVLMHEAGAFKVAGALRIYEADLLAYEARLATPSTPSQGGKRPRLPRVEPTEELGDRWWDSAA